jgi:hypothetical protein
MGVVVGSDAREEERSLLTIVLSTDVCGFQTMKLWISLSMSLRDRPCRDNSVPTIF